MPFQSAPRTYVSGDPSNAVPESATGCYGIFKDATCIYVGSGLIRQRLNGHLNGDNPCITAAQPNRWLYSFTSSVDPFSTFEEQRLCDEYRPSCNLRNPMGSRSPFLRRGR